MRPTIILLLSCLVVSTFASAITDKKLKEISKSQFGKTLIDTIQIELKSSRDPDPRPQLVSLLQEIRAEAQSAISDLNTQNSAKQQQCEQNRQDLQGRIDELNQNIQDDSVEILAKQRDAQTLTLDINSKQSIVDVLQPYLNQITAQRASDQAEFEAEDAARVEIISNLQKAAGFITDRLAARQGETGGEAQLLEKQNVLLEVKNTVNSHKFKRMSPGWSQLVSFLATKALKNMQDDEDTASVAGLQQVVSLIQQIIGDISVVRGTSDAANTQQADAFNEESEDLSSQLDLLNDGISTSQAQLKVSQDRVAAVQNSQEEAQGLLDAANAELSDNNQSCTQYSNQYSQNFANRNTELGLINDVLEIVQNDLGVISQYVSE